MPRHLRTLPWVEINYPRELAELRRDFPDDIVIAPAAGNPSPLKKGDPYGVGEATDVGEQYPDFMPLNATEKLGASTRFE